MRRTIHMTLALRLALVAGATACVDVDDADDGPEIGETRQEVRTDVRLPVDREFRCEAGGEYPQFVPPETVFSVDLMNGETLRVGGTAVVEYKAVNPAYDKALIETVLSCRVGTTTTNDPAQADVLSRSAVNQWIRSGYGSRLTATHTTSAIFTAPHVGMHRYTCWLTVRCAQKPPEVPRTAVVKGNVTYLTRYSPNEYPGTSWKQDITYPVRDTQTHTPGGSQTWYAGTTTANDTEVVVSWLPRLTTCVRDDISPVGPGYCYDPNDLSIQGYDADGFFDWRLVVYQYRGDTLCNVDGGNWRNGNRIVWNDHHVDLVPYSRPVAIKEGWGSHADCGNDTDPRKFKVYAQIRKTVDPGSSDIFVSGGQTARTNLLIYSR